MLKIISVVNIKYFSIILMLGLLTCLTSCEELSEEEKIVNSIINQHAEEQEKQNNLMLIGAGSSMPDKVRGFVLDYISYRKLTIPEARRLYLQGVGRLLNMINNNEKLKPFMCEYPFTVRNLNYKLSFHEKGKSFVEPPHVAYVFLSIRGEVCYSFYDNDSEAFIRNMAYSEPYEEALRIVQEENNR